MIRKLGVIVCDTSPLFTLALGDALDTLLMPGVPVSIPDAVYFEATRVEGAPGADRIAAWTRDNLQVRIVPTTNGLDQFRRFEEGRAIRGLGEQAAVEEMMRIIDRDPEAVVLLIFEDSDIAKRRGLLGDHAELITTGDFLRELEAAGRIQSADAVLDAAAATDAMSTSYDACGRRNVELS